ncbi:MAG TPA: oligopeptide/dipeptide ABC transporter ATP-binding protein [Micromonosporaceae bacterium]|nr:oligopeptide/dipeptide ABC transporter ATP-binding protein [Mycobacterium sp.]
MSRSADPVLEVRDLVRHFPVRGKGVLRRTLGHVKAVDGVSLTIRTGETLGLVGESGCGKSTLARLILALDRPDAGTVSIAGADVFGLGRRELREFRRHMQIVLQDPYSSLNPRMTVGEIIGEPFDIHPSVAPRADRLGRVRELMDRVGLNPDHFGRHPYQFSGGQRQRIGIARALALSPDLLVLDEPVSALDVSVQAQVINLLKEIQEDLGLAYLFIAHDLSVVRHVSDRVAVMYLGRLVEQGSAEQVHGAPTHPYAQALLSAVSEPDPTAPAFRQRIVLEGEVPSPLDPPSGCAFRTRCWKAQDICAQEAPALIERPGSDHPSACHFADATLPEIAA